MYPLCTGGTELSALVSAQQTSHLPATCHSPSSTNLAHKNGGLHHCSTHNSREQPLCTSGWLKVDIAMEIYFLGKAVQVLTF